MLSQSTAKHTARCGFDARLPQDHSCRHMVSQLLACLDLRPDGLADVPAGGADCVKGSRVEWRRNSAPVPLLLVVALSAALAVCRKSHSSRSDAVARVAGEAAAHSGPRSTPPGGTGPPRRAQSREGRAAETRACRSPWSPSREEEGSAVAWRGRARPLGAPRRSAAGLCGRRHVAVRGAGGAA